MSDIIEDENTITLDLSDEEYKFLITYAVNQLLKNYFKVDKIKINVKNNVIKVLDMPKNITIEINECDNNNKYEVIKTSDEKIIKETIVE